jgi:uncharacterized protein YndB with AHSA1/START domain
MIKEKITLEFELKNVSLPMLWTYISTPNGLCKWFCDDVSVEGKTHTFTWQKMPQDADLIHFRQGSFVRFRWEEDEDTKYFFELKINTGEMSGEIELEITDFAFPEDIEDTKGLWKTQVESLKRSIGV